MPLKAMSAPQRLSNLVEHFESQVKNVEQKWKQSKTSLPGWASHCFPGSVDSPSEALEHIKREIKKLDTLLARNSPELAQAQLGLIERQMESMAKLFKSANIYTNNEKLDQKAKQKRYKNKVKTLFTPTNTLYQELAQHHDWLRQLEDKVRLKQEEIAQQPLDSHLTQQLLVLKQRLGRCQQATTKLEEKIQAQEKRQFD